MRYRALYAWVGVLLGLGAPLGALLGRGVILNHLWWAAWMASEWQGHAYFYVYMTVGCVIVFTAFGFSLGRLADKLRRESSEVSDTFQTLNMLAIKDGLTGLYNHRYLQERLALEMEIAERRATPLTCLMIDLDDFKAVNDQFGHPFGDTVLSVVARLIRDNVRNIDTAGRYGGEEFLILMPQTQPEIAERVAERIRYAVESHNFQARGIRANLTLSIGIATYPMAGVKPGDKAVFLKVVDDALYLAKRSGKNRVFYQASKNHGRILQQETR